MEVVDCGVDLERFRVEPAPEGPPAFLCVGSLTERKNVVRLAEAFGRLGEGTLTFVGDGPLRADLEGRPGVTVVGKVPHEEVPAWIARSHVVCQPSLIEPFGLSLLEAMACGRSVVATRIGGPPEFVTPEAGVLVDPTDVNDLARGLAEAAKLPCPNPQAPGGAGGGDSPASRSRTSRRRSTSGLTVSSRPAVRATSSACSYDARTFSGATPCFSRLSPVTSSF